MALDVLLFGWFKEQSKEGTGMAISVERMYEDYPATWKIEKLA
jgi:hypothetical protein